MEEDIMESHNLMWYVRNVSYYFLEHKHCIAHVSSVLPGRTSRTGFRLGATHRVQARCLSRRQQSFRGSDRPYDLVRRLHWPFVKLLGIPSRPPRGTDKMWSFHMARACSAFAVCITERQEATFLTAFKTGRHASHWLSRSLLSQWTGSLIAEWCLNGAFRHCLQGADITP